MMKQLNAYRTQSTLRFVALFVFTMILSSGCNDLKKTLPSPNNASVEVHGSGWLDTNSANFHGLAIKNDANGMQSCISCHGSLFDGGSAEVSCVKCHGVIGSHSTGWVDTLSLGFHGVMIRNAGWDMRSCKSCHGASYGGGIAASSCLTCHTKAGGPENCSTCHGSDASPAPPPDLHRNYSETIRGVGAHQSHVATTSIAAALQCSDCHNVPVSVYAPGHVDSDLPAEIVFNSALARTVTNEPSTQDYDASLPLVEPNPVYNADTLKCQNTYCHGAFKNGNPDNAPVWNLVGIGQDSCGTCHGDVTLAVTDPARALPRTSARGGTHPGSTSCSGCHAGVVNASRQIIDPTKHMNGKLNVFGGERDY